MVYGIGRYRTYLHFLVAHILAFFSGYLAALGVWSLITLCLKAGFLSSALLTQDRRGQLHQLLARIQPGLWCSSPSD